MMVEPTRNRLIDSSVVIPYIRQNPSIVARFDATPNKYLSPTIVAEIAYGAYRSQQPGDGLQRVDAITSKIPILTLDGDIGFAVADLKNALVKRNQLIPENDIWIAATAIFYDMTLIARDGHFARLTSLGLRYEQW